MSSSNKFDIYLQKLRRFCDILGEPIDRFIVINETAFEEMTLRELRVAMRRAVEVATMQGHMRLEELEAIDNDFKQLSIVEYWIPDTNSVLTRKTPRPGVTMLNLLSYNRAD